MNIYVSNISYTATDEALQEAFAAHGVVESARVIRDRISGRSRGFGFVEMPNEEEGRKAIEALAGIELMGRAISVREARPKEEGGDKAVKGENGEKAQQGERAPRVKPPRPEKPKEPEIVVIQRGMY
jgi:RNA recognition motif-containing protein